MGRKIACSVCRCTGCILGGLMVLFFAVFFIGQNLTGPRPIWLAVLTAQEIAMFAFAGVALIGLITAYFRMLAGAIIAILGAVGFLVINGPGSLMVAKAWPWYLLLLAGLLHLAAWTLRSPAPKVEPEGVKA